MGVIRERDLSLQNRGAVLVVISIVFNSIGLGLVAMRLGTKWASRRKLGLEDCAILLSLVRCFGLCVDCQRLAHLADSV